MGKLVIKYKGKPIGDVSLKLGDTTIGRHDTCDIVLSHDKSVSGKHAVIKTVGRKSTFEDLNSTNGSFIEAERITIHELKHGETITIGDHQMIYRDELVLDATAPTKIKPANANPTNLQNTTRIISKHAQLLAMDGKDKGKRIPLVKEETLLDNPGKSPARIYRGPDGYVVHAQLGPGEPRVNDKPVPPGGHILEDGDVIEVAGTKYQVFK